MPFIETKDSTKLHVKDAGKGRPVVLIHGWPLTGDMFEYQTLALLEAGYRVISYDRRGFGQSGHPATGYDYDTFADDLAAVLDGLDVKDASLVGFSMGGGEVARYVARHGTSRVRGAVFAAAVPPYLYKSADNPEGGLDDATIDEFEAAVRTDRLAFLDDFTTKFFSAAGALKVSEAQREYAKALGAFASPKGTLDCIGAFGRTDFRADLAAFSDLPTLVIHGDADAIVPFEVSGQRTARLIARAELVVIEGGPHGVNASHPAAFNAALLRFLDR